MALPFMNVLEILTQDAGKGLKRRSEKPDSVVGKTAIVHVVSAWVIEER